MRSPEDKKEDYPSHGRKTRQKPFVTDLCLLELFIKNISLPGRLFKIFNKFNIQ